MGMFSWNCLACGFSLRECRGCSVDNWMCEAVVLAPNGTRVIGWYNSYGQVGDSLNLADQIGDFSVYHKACWQLVGKPEFTKQASHAHDQGFCHAMHGQPFPLPTLEWLDKAKMWQAVDRVIMKWGDIAAERDHDEAKRKFDLFTKEGQDRLCREYKADKVARATRNRDRFDVYLHDPNEDAVAPEKEEDPKTFLYECITFDYGWLGVCVSRHLREW